MTLPSAIVMGCDKPAGPPALQVHMSRVRWRAGGLAGRRYKYKVEWNWRGTGLGAHGLASPAAVLGAIDWEIRHGYAV